MYLTKIQTMIMILSIAAGTMLTRFLPFILFPENKKVPIVVEYLGKFLPASMIGMLVVYCLRNCSFLTVPYGIPEIASIMAIVILHRWKKNVLLSIGLGTALYMVMIRL